MAEDTAPTTAQLDNMDYMMQPGNCDDASKVENYDLAPGEKPLKAFDISTKPARKIPGLMTVLILTPLTFGVYLLYFLCLVFCCSDPKGGTKAKLIITNKMRIVLWQMTVTQGKKDKKEKKHAVDVKFYNISDLCYINYTFDKEPRLCQTASFASTLRLYFGKYPNQATVTSHSYSTMDNPFNTMVTMTPSLDKRGLRLRFLAETILNGAAAAKGIFGSIFGAAAKGPGKLLGAAAGAVPKGDDAKAALHTLGSISDPSVQFSVDGTCPSYLEITCDANDDLTGKEPLRAFEAMMGIQRVIVSARGAQRGLVHLEGRGNTYDRNSDPPYANIVDSKNGKINLSPKLFPVGQEEKIAAVFPEAHIITCGEWILSILSLGIYYFLFVRGKIQDKGVLVSTNCRICQLYTRGSSQEGPGGDSDYSYQMNMYFVHKVSTGMISFDPSRQSYMELQTTCGCLKIAPIVRKSGGDTAIGQLKEFFQVMTRGACKSMETDQILPAAFDKFLEGACFETMWENAFLLPKEQMLAYLPNTPLQEGKGACAKCMSCGGKPIGLTQELVLTNKRLLAGSKKTNMGSPWCDSCKLDESWVFVWADLDSADYIGLSMSGIVQQIPLIGCCCKVDTSFSASVVEVAILDAYPVCVQNYMSTKFGDEAEGMLEQDTLKNFRSVYSQLMVARQDKFFNLQPDGEPYVPDQKMEAV